MEQTFTHKWKSGRTVLLRLVVLSLLAIFTAGNLMAQGTEPVDSDGDGRLEISTKGHLLYLSQNSAARWNADYEQTGDIVFTDADFQPGGDFYNDGKGFSPIGGGSGNAFLGNYYGHNHTIDGLYINRPTQDYIGLFGRTQTVNLSNIRLTNIDITGKDYVGGLIGYAFSGLIESCIANGTVNGYDKSGGISGYISFTEIKNTYAAVDVSGNARIGGFAGTNNGEIAHCYASGDVSGNDKVGGFVGQNSNKINKCYSIGHVSANSNFGGFAGSISTVDIDNSFWDTETSGQPSTPGSEATGKTTAEMKDISTFTDLSTEGLDEAWDFKGFTNDDNQPNDHWDFVAGENNGYPTYFSPGTTPEDSDGNGKLEIATKGHLLYLSQSTYADFHASYEQVNHIIFSDADFQDGGDFYNDGKGFSPIGINFQGHYDGQNYIIDGLYINRPEQDYVGLFGHIKSSNLSNIRLTNIAITGKDNVGGLAGYKYSGTSIHSYTSGEVIGENQVGGLIGYNSWASISESYSHADVSATTSVGGFVGEHYRSPIENCYATGSVTGVDQVGGLIGYNRGSSGWNNIYAKIYKSYSAGWVTGSTEVGGLIGKSSMGKYYDCFWDNQASGQTSSAGGTGKSNAVMKNVATFTDLTTAGLDEAWDFKNNPNDDSNSEDIWKMELSEELNKGYPILSWQEIPLAPPTVSTLSMWSISATNALARGLITDLGNPNPTQHGVCYNRTGNPTLEDNKTEQGPIDNSPTIFLAPIDDLLPDRTYYLKAYAINDVDTVFGEEVSFTTDKKEVYFGGSFTVADKEYDATTDAAIAENNLFVNGAADGDDVVFENISVEFASADAANDIEVNIVNAELAGDDSEHYEFYSWAFDNALSSTGNIIKKELTVTADDEEREQCAPNPSFTYAYAGFVDGENETMLTTEPVANCSADASSVAGEYDITLSGGEDENYAFNYVNGTLTIIEDTTNPVALTQDLTIALDAAGEVSITAEQVDNGSTDNCGIEQRIVMPSTFTCAHLGDNEVTLTVTDAAGNESSQTAVITVEDNLAPTVVTQDITVVLNADGAASITTADINDGSSDNCSIETYELDVTAFDCSNVGENVVTLTTVDPSGNTTSQNATVTVNDNLAPEVLTQDITVELDATGQAAITTGDINNGSTDNCAIDSYQLDVSSFDCSNVGENVVTLTVTDVNGNTAEETAVVTVQDNMAPTVIAQDMTVELDVSGVASISIEDIDNGSYDNCAIDTRQLDATSFDCLDVGDNNVTLTVTDVNGNEAQQTAIVTVEDNIGPTVITQDTLIELNPDGEANVTSLEIDNGSDDNCAIDTYDLDQSFFDESDIGENVVTLTVTDVHGNATSETAIVTIADNTPPTIITQPVTLYLDMNGEATLTPGELDNGSYDNVEITSMEIDLDYFACGDLGEYTVTLTASDMSGNSSSATETVTVLDTITPSDLLVEVSEPLCYGGTDGLIELIPQDGSGDVAYSIDNGNTWQQNDGLFGNLSIGTFHIMVEGANGCQTVYGDNPVTITQPEPVVMDMVETTDATCYGASNGMIDAEASGGTGDLYYSIDGGDTWQMNDGFFYGLTAGDYNVLVKDANDCLLDYAANPVVISQPDAVVIEGVAANDITCNGAANGTIEVNAFGGTGQLEYSINNGDAWQESPLFEGLTPGTYQVRVRDDNACLNIYDANPVTLTQPEALSLASVEVSGNTCYESNDGAIAATAQGGTGQIEYSINSGETWQSDGSFEELPAGSYNLMIQDENGCQFNCEMNPISITQPEELVLSGVDKTDITCYGQANGTIEVFAGGGTGALTYSIDDGANWQSGGEFTGLTEGAYDVWVKDAKGCMTPWPENPVTIQEPESLAFADVMVSEISCHNEEDGEIEMTGQGGTEALSYSIDNGSNWEASNSFDNLEPREYNIWMKDANDCTVEYADNPITLENPEALEVSINAEPGLEVPVGDTVGLSASTNYFVNYDWQPVGEETASIEITSDEAGEEEYTVTVTNAQGCIATASETIVVFVPTGMEPETSQAKIILMPNPSDGKFVVRAEGISSAVDLTIFDATGNKVLHKKTEEPARGIIEQPFNFSNRASGLYYIKVATDSGKWVKKLILQH